MFASNPFFLRPIHVNILSLLLYLPTWRTYIYPNVPIFLICFQTSRELKPRNQRPPLERRVLPIESTSRLIKKIHAITLAKIFNYHKESFNFAAITSKLWEFFFVLLQYIFQSKSERDFTVKLFFFTVTTISQTLMHRSAPNFNHSFYTLRTFEWTKKIWKKKKIISEVWRFFR